MQYGDAVTYVKDGKPLNALVVKSSSDTLSLIYLDPISESLTNQGNLSRVISTAIGVKPLADGARFGWKESLIGVQSTESLREEVSRLRELDSTLQSLMESGAVKSDAPMTHEEAVKIADDVFGQVELGAPESPHPDQSPAPESSSDSPEVSERIPGPAQPPNTGEHPVA